MVVPRGTFSKRLSWWPVRLHPYNRQLIIFGKWRQDYGRKPRREPR